MTEDAMYIVDLFNMQIGSLQHEMLDKAINRLKFDKFSYGSWAIQETLRAIKEYEGCVSVGVIRSILHIQETDYEKYYNSNPTKNNRYGHALKTIVYLLKLTEGYIYE